MRKLSLEMDALRVESFATVAPAAEPRGTVHGNEITGINCTRINCPLTQWYTCYPATPRMDVNEMVTALCC